MFELHYVRKPNSEITNLLNGNFISAKPDTIQVYSLSGEGGQSELLPMKIKKKTSQGVNYPFSFLEKEHTKFET